MVGAARLELATPRSQSECATNCATPRQKINLVEVNVTIFMNKCNHFFASMLL